MMASPGTTRSGALPMTEARILGVDGSTVRVVRALHARGVEAILLKGPALASWLYDDGRRGYSDADLLVPVHKLDTAESTLEELGFSRFPGDSSPLRANDHAQPWIQEDGIAVDLHRTLFGAGVAPEDVWNILWRAREPMSVAGAVVPVLTRPARALLVAVHASQHGPEREQPLEDLRRAIARVDEATWEAAAELAARIELAPTFARGLRLDPTGAELAERLGLLDDRIIDLVERRGSGARLAIGFERLKRAQGPAAKLALLRREAFPKPSHLRWWSPVASRGPLGLAAAYAWRVAWLLWHAPPSVIAWRRARRASEP
jgi:hypothetical protein